MSASARPLTLADVALPRPRLLTNAALIAGASAVTALAAQAEIRLPWTPVPVTGQTFAVLLSGAVLGARRAFLAQALYLLEGALGLPVFAGGGAGALHLAGPTGGYLVAFPFAAAATGALAQRGWDRRPPTARARERRRGSIRPHASGARPRCPQAFEGNRPAGRGGPRLGVRDPPRGRAGASAFEGPLRGC
jgi:hypothetical protein